ncbi:MAG: hypothetical protein ABID38_04600 [Candidatus Diapherotrites archaeon]
MGRVGEKGQAAITDAMYFLLIVSGLCVFLFVFSATYGENISRQINREFNAEFTASALKTILYSSTARDTTQSLYEYGAEIDYLLAYVKEDYSDDEKFSEEIIVVLADDINAVMSPYSSSNDYFFTIVVSEDRKYAFTLVHLSKFTIGHGRSVDVTPSDPAHIDYICSLVSDRKKDILKTNVGNTAASFSKILLAKEDPAKRDYKTIAAETELVVWNPKQLPSDIFNETFDEETGWGCRDLEDIRASLS